MVSVLVEFRAFIPDRSSGMWPKMDAEERRSPTQTWVVIKGRRPLESQSSSHGAKRGRDNMELEGFGKRWEREIQLQRIEL